MEPAPKPSKEDDRSRPEKCEECGHKIGYAPFTARLVDGTWTLRHDLPGYVGRSCKEAYG